MTLPGFVVLCVLFINGISRSSVDVWFYCAWFYCNFRTNEI